MNSYKITVEHTQASGNKGETKVYLNGKQSTFEAIATALLGLNNRYACNICIADNTEAYFYRANGAMVKVTFTEALDLGNYKGLAERFVDRMRQVDAAFSAKYPSITYSESVIVDKF